MFFYNDPYESSTNDTAAMIQRKHEDLADWLYTVVPKCDRQAKALWHLSQCMNISVIVLKLHTGKAIGPVGQRRRQRRSVRVCTWVRRIMQRAAQRAAERARML